MRRGWLAALWALGLPLAAWGHDGVQHKTPEEAAAHVAAVPDPHPPANRPVLDLPFNLGGAFQLTDHTGQPRSQADPDGLPQLLFFGYANCPSICAVAMPTMADATRSLAKRGIRVRPVMITVDPERDTVATMGPALAKLHPDFVGLTGTPKELQAVYDLFQVENTVAFVDPELGPVYAHGSHIYLLDKDGKVLTLFPPILSGDYVAEIAHKYVPPDS